MAGLLGGRCNQAPFMIFWGVPVEEPRRFPFEFGIGLGCRASSTACIVV